MPTDPLDTTAGIPCPELAALRRGCRVSTTASGAYFLARHDDVLAATKRIDAFQASFREPGVVVPPEEQLISEIPEPHHGEIRRIINAAIANTDSVGSRSSPERFARASSTPSWRRAVAISSPSTSRRSRPR